MYLRLSFNSIFYCLRNFKCITSKTFQFNIFLFDTTNFFLTNEIQCQIEKKTSQNSVVVTFNMVMVGTT